MAFRNRFRSLLGLDRSQKEFVEGDSPESLSDVVYKDDAREFEDDPRSNDEVIAGIKDIYFSDSSFDPSDHELKKLPDTLVLEELDEYRNVYRHQLQAVSKKLYTKVLDNHSAYVQELQRVIDLQEALQNASVTCDRGRRHLDKAKREVAIGGLGILAKYRKKQHLIDLLESLRTIKTLQKTDVRLKEMLEEEDYPGAIDLCLECEKAARSFKHYKCISELSSNLQETLIDIEKQLDLALARTSNNFDPVHYQRLQTAYRYLGKTQIAMDQLIIHFMNSVHQESFAVILEQVEDSAKQDVPTDAGLHHLHFGELCKKVGVSHFTPCLLELCKALWKVMLNFHQVIRWHEQYDPAMHVSEEDAVDGDTGAEATYNRNYIRQKLDHGLNRIWKEVQERVKTHLLGTDLAYFKYDDFIYVLDLVNRLIAVGEEFCGSKSEDLHDSIRTQTVNYFKNYHRSRMDELRMFLENEAWELCPVKTTFKIVDLQEFRFMKHTAPVVKTHRRSASGTVHVTTEAPSFFARYCNQGDPFDDVCVDDEAEDVLEQNGVVGNDVNENDKRKQNQDDEDDDDEDDEDIPEELKQDYVDENTGEVPTSRSDSATRSRKHQMFLARVPCITNTTLNVLRVFGKYMQMMNVLKPIAFDVVICMSQLFDYYLFAITSFFAPDVMADGSIYGLSIKLKATLKRISDNLILHDSSDMLASADDMKVPYPHLSPMVDVSRSDTMFGLAQRILATESLVFLAGQFEFLHPHLEALIPPNKRAFLSQFYSQTVSTVHELRKPIYGAVASRVIDYEQTLQLMTGVRWDVREIMSQHNTYVDILVREFQVFSMKLSQLEKQIPVPKEAHVVLWAHCIRLANRTFVEGFASAKKCSNEGRALMQLDFQQYLMKLERLTNLRPIPDREFVETYVKAFYLTENEMDRWIREHKEYTPKHLTSLVTCGVGSHITKKGRQKLLAIIDEMDKSRVR